MAKCRGSVCGMYGSVVEVSVVSVTVERGVEQSGVWGRRK